METTGVQVEKTNYAKNVCMQQVGQACLNVGPQSFMNLRKISGGPSKAEAFQALNHIKQIGTVKYLFSLAQSLENNILYLPSDHWEHW